MHSADISAALKRAQSNQAQLSRDLGVAKSSVQGVVAGSVRSARIEAAISEKVGLPLHVLWPQWHPAPQGVEPTQPHVVGANAKLAGMENILIQMYRGLDVRLQMKLLEYATELSGETRSQAPHVTQLDAPRLARTNAEMNQGLIDAVRKPLADANAELAKAVEDAANAPQRALEKLAAETGIQIGRNFGQVNKGGKNIFNKNK